MQIYFQNLCSVLLQSKKLMGSENPFLNIDGFCRIHANGTTVWKHDANATDTMQKKSSDSTAVKI